MKKRILLTGAAGRIGTDLRRRLAGDYRFRCLDVVPMEEEQDTRMVNIVELDPLGEAMDGIDAVIHLAANLIDTHSWEDVSTNGVTGTYNVFEAARRAGVGKVIYASTNYVLGKREMQQGKWVSPDMPMHPVGLYGVGKATGEMLGRHFADAYGMSIVCLRIGYYHPEPPYPRNLRDDILRSWCSPEDLAQLVRGCLETDGLGFQVFYAVSNNKRRLWDIENARKLIGYQPKSNAEDVLKAARSMRRTEGMTAGRAHLMRAAILDDPEAFKSWQLWLEAVDIEKDYLDSISYRLLPLVYHNLSGQHVAHPLMTRLKGVYRRAWLENQLALQQVVPFIAQLHDRGILLMLLDDLTSILRLYDGQGVRRPYSLDLLVQPVDVAKLLDFLQGSNTWPKVRNGKNFLRVETPLEIWPPLDLDFTIAWRVFPLLKTHQQALSAWQTAGSATLGDSPVGTLDLESHFLRCCLRALGARPEPAFFALIDVAWMLTKQTETVDWEQVIELTRAHHQVLCVTGILQEVAAFAAIPKANQLLQQLHKLPVSLTDRLEHRLVYEYHPFPNLFLRSIRRLLLYGRSIKRPGPLGFLRYLQFAWGGGRLLSLPRLAARHFASAWTRSWQG